MPFYIRAGLTLKMAQLTHVIAVVCGVSLQEIIHFPLCIAAAPLYTDLRAAQSNCDWFKEI